MPPNWCYSSTIQTNPPSLGSAILQQCFSAQVSDDRIMPSERQQQFFIRIGPSLGQCEVKSSCTVLEVQKAVKLGQPVSFQEHEVCRIQRLLGEEYKQDYI